MVHGKAFQTSIGILDYALFRRYYPVTLRKLARSIALIQTRFESCRINQSESFSSVMVNRIGIQSLTRDSELHSSQD